MKRIFLLLAIVVLCVPRIFAQINQDFANIPQLHSLTSQCWQFYGTQLISSPASTDKYLSLTPPSANGTAWLKTAYLHLTTISSIGFSYQMSAPLTNGATCKLTVGLLALDGTSTPLGEVTLNQHAGTVPLTFRATSPISGVRRLVIQVTTVGNDVAPLFIDNLVVDGNFEYNPPYACREKEDGAVSIHYLKSFAGQLNNDRVRLQWVVAENENNKQFEVERSVDGKEFKIIATVPATGNVAVETYSYEERTATNAYYRLKLVSRGGLRMYSNVLFFKSGDSKQSLTILQNPVQQTLRVGFIAESRTSARLTLYSLTGAAVFERRFEAQKDFNLVNYSLDLNLTPGIYLAEIVCGQKRMTAKLLKE